jgi:hypothetical protein
LQQLFLNKVCILNNEKHQKGVFLTNLKLFVALAKQPRGIFHTKIMSWVTLKSLKDKKMTQQTT